jgi:hypothetical protein
MCLEGCGWGWMGVWMEVWCPCASVVALWAVACAACRVFARVLFVPRNLYVGAVVLLDSYGTVLSYFLRLSRRPVFSAEGCH